LNSRPRKKTGSNPGDGACKKETYARRKPGSFLERKKKTDGEEKTGGTLGRDGSVKGKYGDP